MEQVHQSFDEVETISSSVDKAQEESSCYHTREVDDYDDSFYDAQDGFSSQKASHGCNLSTGNWKGSADLSFTDRSQPLSSASRTSEEFFEAYSTLPHFHRKKSHSSGSLNNEDLFFGRPNGSALEVRLCNRLTFGLLEGQAHYHEYPPEQLREKVIVDLKEDSRHTAPFWLKNRKPLYDTSIPKWRGFSRGKFAERCAPNDLYDPMKMEELRTPVSIRQGPQDLPRENSGNSTSDGEIMTEMRETKQVRTEAKSLCIKQWEEHVRNLPELLWFLQVFYRVYGSVLITECEEMIESCIDPLGGGEGFSWKRYGRHMDVKRMFELKMFRLSAPPNRMKVQPVDCILNVGFRIVQKGLASELYKIVAKDGKATIDDVNKHLEPFFHNLSERNRKDEIRAALKKLKAVVRKVGSRLELENSEEFFVVTDVD
ncbi:hypothetical protein GCK32_015632 [Trichostrongylus colubriformis]|uniref:Uncharacterized protein n=1 Tax=Trichostrongylus colubriformis TaxID=6319 RepID=A0AAN8IDN4_TRICO